MGEGGVAINAILYSAKRPHVRINIFKLDNLCEAERMREIERENMPLVLEAGV